MFFSAGYQKLPTAGSPTEVYFIELNILHNDNRLGCLESGKSKVVLVFKDGTKAECSQISDNDCDPIGFASAFALMQKQGNKEMMKQNFDKLLTTDITNIEVYTSETKLMYNVKTTQRPVIRSHFALLDKTIKASL